MDINTIRFSHTDLDSVAEAKSRLEQFIHELDESKEFHNPISAVLQDLCIHVRQDGHNIKTLVESFQEIAGHIIGELQESKRQRELLWSKVFDTPRNRVGDQVSSHTDLSGYWESNLGRVKLIQDGNLISGKYEYGLVGWVGELTGHLIADRVVFQFHWLDALQINGVGYWDVRHDKLQGRWFYSREAPFSIKDYIQKPSLFDGLTEITTDEERRWVMTRLRA